jgi:two-component system CheB/CheR fusion protein
MDPLFTKLDFVLPQPAIYLTPELQKKLLRLFHYGLNPGGFCFGERGDCWQLY